MSSKADLTKGSDVWQLIESTNADIRTTSF
jgi:hypothetical protein